MVLVLPLIFPSLQFNAFYGLSPPLQNSLVQLRAGESRLSRERSGRDAHVCNGPVESRLCQVQL